MQLLQYTVFLFGVVTQAVTLKNAEDGFDALQQWYNQSIGETSTYPQPHPDHVKTTDDKLQASGFLRQDGGIVPIVFLPYSLLKHHITDTFPRSHRDSRSRSHRRQRQGTSSSHL
jgi:hypothetical protein